MIDEKTTELLVERLIRRIEKMNTYFLKKMGSSIKKIKNLTPSQAQQLVQILKYGGNYEEIIKEISKYTSLNINEVDNIFSNYAKKDQLFYEKFYQYRNINFIPFEQNNALKMQTMALSRVARNELYDFTRTNVLGYTINGKFYNMRDTYNQLLDDALLNISQGKETFDSAMSQILKDIGESGIRTLNYESGRNIRIDSAINMHLKSRLRELHNENQKLIGEDIGADGVEISVHENPAPDHEMAQGRQFSNEEYEKLNSGLQAKDYTGKIITLDHDDKNGYRPISEMNCYHYIFSIVLGVSKPEYNEKQLQEIIGRNNKGFEYEGKHYTMYEGTQLQRNLERRIREQKDTQTLALASGNEFVAGEAQNKITILGRKYKDLSKASGLPTKLERAKVSSYRRSASASKVYKEEINKYKVGTFDISKYTNDIKSTTNDVVLMPERRNYITTKHPESIPYMDKMTDLVNNPDQIYMQASGRKNSIWVIKEYEGQKIQAIIKINKPSLYQKKELGYKNSIIHMHPIRSKYIENKIKKGDIKKLFDINNKK